MTTRKRVKKLKQTNKRYSIKGWHTKEFLKKGTRLDDQIKKKQHHWKMLWARNVFVPQFMLSCIFKI